MIGMITASIVLSSISKLLTIAVANGMDFIKPSYAN